MVEKNNQANHGGNRRNRGPERGGRQKEVKLKSEAYQFLDDENVQELHGKALEGLRAAFSQGRNNENIKNINSFSTELINLQAEMRARGLMEDDEESTEEDEFFEEMAEEQAEGINENRGKEPLSGDELGEFELKAQNALRRRLGKPPLDSFDEIWDEAHDDNRRFKREKRKEGRKQGKEKEKDVLTAHQEAFQEGKAEKDYTTFSELYDDAHEQNRQLNQIRESTEYKVEKSLEPIFREIDSFHKESSRKIEQYEKSGWLSKLNPMGRNEAARSRETIVSIENLKQDLIKEETNYAKKREELAGKMDILSSEDAGRLSKMYEGGRVNNQVRAEYENLINQMSILEENHQDEKDRILLYLQKLGVDVFDEDMGLKREMGMKSDYESKEGNKKSFDFSKVDSDHLTVDEELFKKSEERKMHQDSHLRGKLGDIESYMKLHAEVGERQGATLSDFFNNVSDLEVSKRNASEHQIGLNERDSQIQREVEKYKKGILEARLKIRRLTAIIEEERKKDPEKMDFALILEAGERVQSESLNLTKYGEGLKEKVITVDQKSRLNGLLNKVGVNITITK